ncbi:MAG: cell envelope integrity EipB family protein [Hyphomicrobiales bacterium]|nr:cell envelope integrity EipB family protein [Hyphomicrobiales bacterium]
MMSRSLLVLVSGALALLASPVFAAGTERVVLSPHRAVYDLKLDTSKPSRSVDAATGRIAFDFTGDACDGYSLSFRQVTVIESAETGSRQIDVRTSNFEDGEAKLFRFKTQSAVGGRMDDRVDGVAEQRDGGYRVQLSQPKRDRYDFASDVIFPSEHLKRIVTAARRGDTTLNVKVYDGSDDGKQVYDTFAVMGRRMEPGPLEGLEDAVRKPDMQRVARWPVSISYFKSGSGEVTPSYAISFDLFENGVTRALVLDYKDFRMTGALVRLDLMPASACAK